MVSRSSRALDILSSSSSRVFSGGDGCFGLAMILKGTSANSRCLHAIELFGGSVDEARSPRMQVRPVLAQFLEK